MNLQAEVVGKVSFRGAAERGEFFLFRNLSELDNLPFDESSFKIFLNGAEISADTLKRQLGISNEKNSNSQQLTANSSTLLTADYIVFDNRSEFGLQDRFITRETLIKYEAENFFSLKNLTSLGELLSQLKISRVLDVDAFLAKNDFVFVSNFPDVEVDAIDKNSFAEKFPIVENLYRKIYYSLADCRFKNFDALLLTAERTPEEFIDVLIETDSLSENILTFVRKDSALEKFLVANENAFEKISAFPAVNGNWLLIKKSVRDDFKIYVVTHKEIKLDALPEGYEIIHAGHAQAKEKFGYKGDDTGENISRLNRYLNEITALYWMWKNTAQAIIGLCHYRRFFSADEKNFLTETQAREILRGCDIIVIKENFFVLTQHELKSLVCGGDLCGFVEKIFRKHIARKQPDYLDAFDYVSGSYAEFMYEMFITRRKIFDTYCEWLFSFVLDVTEEVLATERLMSVWLMKNNLRLRSLPVIFYSDV